LGTAIYGFKFHRKIKQSMIKYPIRGEVRESPRGRDIVRKRRESWKKRSGGSAMVAATLFSKMLVSNTPNLVRLVSKIAHLRM
jgi:hypothetical protein